MTHLYAFDLLILQNELHFFLSTNSVCFIVNCFTSVYYVLSIVFFCFP